MTREDAYYERILLLCGYWEDYDRWLDSYLETEEPLSDNVYMGEYGKGIEMPI